MRSSPRRLVPRAGVPGRPVPSAAPPERPTPTAAPPAAPTADSSPSPSPTPDPSISPKPLTKNPAVTTDDSDLFHVPPTRFKIRCATHLLHSGMLDPPRRCAGVRDASGKAQPLAAHRHGVALENGCLPVAVMVGEDAR